MFDPGDPTTFALPGQYSRTLRFVPRLLVTAWFNIPLVWMTAFLPVCSPLCLVLFAVGIVANLARHRWLSAAAILLLSPFALFALHATQDYLSGSGRLQFTGLGRPEAYNVDPVYRCERAARGCVVNGTEWVRIWPYNRTLKLLITAFGPMRGSYTGAYPTKADCLAAMTNGTDIKLDALVRDKVKLGMEILTLDSGVGRGLVRDSRWIAAVSDPNEEASVVQTLGPLQAAVWQGCLIIRIPIDTGLDPNNADAVLAVIDPNSGRPFAYYGTGTYQPRSSRVPWRK